MSWVAIKRIREEQGAAIAQAKAITTKCNDEKRSMTPDEEKRFDALCTEAEAKKMEVERVERAMALEADLAAAQERRSQPGREDLNTPEKTAEQRESEIRSEFRRYLLGIPATELRSLTIAGTGVVGDRTFYNQLVTTLKSWAGVRQAGATVLPTSDGNPLVIPTGDDSSNVGQIVGEAVTDNSAADPTIGNVTLNAYRFDSKWIKVSLEMLRDSAFPIEQYIQTIAAERIGRAFNKFSTTGTGTGQPKGFITAAGVGKTAASQSAFTYEELLDLIHSVDAGYRASPSFRLQLADSTLAAARKLKDGSGRYIFVSGTGGVPGTLLDTQYVVNNDLAKLSDGSGSVVVAAGDFSRYYVRDVTAVEVIRANELFIGDGLVGFRIFSRHDGNLADTSAVKTLKLA